MNPYDFILNIFAQSSLKYIKDATRFEDAYFKEALMIYKKERRRKRKKKGEDRRGETMGSSDGAVVAMLVMVLEWNDI